ncbi:MAG: ATP-binding protein [Clostridiaceae bacterium]|nr:ATP-binding protein [Clostridiaceae bacterium]
MLVQFNFKNYKSFKNEATLDMTATSIKEHPYNLIETKSGSKYLKLAAIYGANASGKSNVIEAFCFMHYFIYNSLGMESVENKRSKKTIPVTGFAFDNDSKNMPSEFEVFFIQDDTEYQYGFSVDQERVHEEWLYYRKISGKKYNMLFERTGNNIECGKRMAEAEKFKDAVDDNTLFLTLTARTKVEVSKTVYQWFFNNTSVDFGNIAFESLISRRISPEILENETYKKRIEDFLIAIDTGIKGIRVEKTKDNENKEAYKVYSRHEIEKSNEYIEIPFDQESSGTQKMFCLFDFLWDVMKKGSVLFIDELNAKLHPILVRYIINMFHAPNINENNAQLVFTTHDTFTLTRDVFRRDEIWFVEKDVAGVSNLYSLAEYKLEDDSKVRNDATYSKDYLSGRYGAVPLLKEFYILEGQKSGERSRRTV